MSKKIDLPLTGGDGGVTIVSAVLTPSSFITSSWILYFVPAGRFLVNRINLGRLATCFPLLFGLIDRAPPTFTNVSSSKSRQSNPENDEGYKCELTIIPVRPTVCARKSSCF